MKSTLKVNDKLWQEIKAQFPKIDKAVVKTGIQSDAGENEGVSIAEYAAFNEFGTRIIPERPFMRKTFDDNLANYNKLIERLFKGMLGGKLDAKMAFKILGQQTEDDMKNTILTGNFTPNSAYTIAKKGSSRPLIDTGTMRNSIRYEVENV